MRDFCIRNFKCYECGRELVLSLEHNRMSDYLYKKTIGGRLRYLCSYTCYDHASLSTENPKDYLNEDKYYDLVSRCERSMVGQGKEILHPIKRRGGKSGKV